jgi:hypothetical protein
MTDRDFLEEVNRVPLLLNAGEIMRCLKGADAFWLYDGEPRAEKPHVKLTSGKHSDGYVNVGGAIKDFLGLRHSFAMSLVTKLRQRWNRDITRVVGAGTSSTFLAGDIANVLRVEHVLMKKYEDGESKKQVWVPGNRPLEEDDMILHIEELLTTSFSALAVRAGIRRCNPSPTVHFVPFLPVVVERSNPDDRVTVVEDSEVLPLLQLDIRNYDPDSCPYCKAGSEVVENPKQNWSKLTGK